MALGRLGVLSASTKGLSICSHHHRIFTFSSRFSSNSSIPLLQRLLEEPISRTKSTLDSETTRTNTKTDSPPFPWDAILVSLRSSSPHKAKLVLEWKMEQLLNKDERNCDSYSELIHLCGKAQNLETAMRVFTLMEDRGIKPTSSVLNAVISACLHSGNVITALSIFETMENSNVYKPNSDTYNGFISAFASSGNGKSMLAWYDAKLASGFPGDIQAYEALISGCIKSKSFEDANRFFEEMVSAKIIPNVSILHNMLLGFCEQGDLVKVRGFVDLLLENGWEINGEMAEKLVNFYSELRMMDEMEKLLATLMKEGGGAEVLSPVHYAIIRKYAKLDRLDDVEYSVGRMLKQGISFRYPDDVEKVLSSYFRRAAYDRLDLFLECIKDSYKFSRSTYDLLIAGYRRAGLQEKMDKVIQDMQMAGLA